MIGEKQAGKLVTELATMNKAILVYLKDQYEEILPKPVLEYGIKAMDALGAGTITVPKKKRPESKPEKKGKAKSPTQEPEPSLETDVPPLEEEVGPEAQEQEASLVPMPKKRGGT